MLLDIKHQFFFPIRRRTIANGLGPRMVMRPLGRSSRTGLWIFASFRLLFDFSNLYNWSLLHERYLPIRHKMGTSSDAQICGSMVFVWEILLSGRELLPVTAWFKLVTIITSKADRCSGLTNYERLVNQTDGNKDQQKSRSSCEGAGRSFYGSQRCRAAQGVWPGAFCRCARRPPAEATEVQDYGGASRHGNGIFVMIIYIYIIYIRIYTFGCLCTRM